MKKLFVDFWQDKYKVILFFILIFLCFFSVYALQPRIAGDSLLYTSSIQVLQTGVQSAGFVPMMINSTYLGLRLIMFLNFFTHNIATAWILLDSVLYVIMGLFFYSLVKRILRDAQAAFLGALFLVTNYAAVSFGLAYMMDMGGWAFYMASIYFSYRYLESEPQENKWLYISALMVGIGGLYKEYAFVAYGILFWLIIFKNWKNWRQIIWKIFLTGCISFTPILLVNVYTYIAFNHYTYINWYLAQHVYHYQNRPVEFIKSFGSIYIFGWLLFIAGFSLFFKDVREIVRNKSMDKNTLFIGLVLLSGCAVLVWPVVTRVLFITMPGVVLVSSLAIKKLDTYRLYIIVPLLIICVFCSYLMDAFILNFVNLPF